MAWVLDLDGVVWRGRPAIPGAAEAVARLRAAGERVLFVTNNSAVPRLVEVEAKLPSHGIDPGDRRHLGDGRRQAGRAGSSGCSSARGRAGRGAEARGAAVVDAGAGRHDGDADAVVVGLPPGLRLRAARPSPPPPSARRPAASPPTTTPPTRRPTGLIPGGGAIPWPPSTASGVTAGRGRQAVRADGRPGARRWPGRPAWWSATGPTPTAASPGRSGYPFGLVLTGVTRPERAAGATRPPSSSRPTWRRSSTRCSAAESARAPGSDGAGGWK